jgi:hypothetical protein
MMSTMTDKEFKELLLLSDRDFEELSANYDAEPNEALIDLMAEK